jgi:DNA-binding transcriptional LysR family regulator
MDLKRLRTFVAVAEHGSVSKAAEHLRITQPALSRQLRDLQREFGVVLFEHSSRRLRLSGAGEELLPHCRRLLGQAEAVAERARSLARGGAGVLRVGATPQMVESVFPGFLRHYAERRPGVQVRPVEAGAVEQLTLLERGEVHLAIGFHPGDAARVASHPLPPLHVLAARAPSLPVRGAGRGRLEVSELAGVPLLLLDRSFGSRRVLDAACRLARVEQRVVFEGAAPHTLLALAEAGLGVAVVPDSVRIARAGLRIERLAYRGEPLQGPLAVLWDRLRPLPRYAEDFPAAFAAYLRGVLPVTRPSGAASGRQHRSQGRSEPEALMPDVSDAATNRG